MSGGRIVIAPFFPMSKERGSVCPFFLGHVECFPHRKCIQDIQENLTDYFRGLIGVGGRWGRGRGGGVGRGRG